MAFDTLYSGAEKLVLTSAEPGAVKSALETLSLGQPGQPDQLDLHYDCLVESVAGLNSLLLALSAPGANLSAVAVTAGTWIGGVPRLESRPEELPFARIAVPCQGIAQAKPDAVRWFAVTGSQSAENVLYDSTVWEKFQAEVIGIGVEIDRVILGAAPVMSQVGTSVTPAGAPATPTSPWASLESPTRQYPDGWFLADRRFSQLNGSATAWFGTDVFRYNFALTP